jgi:hypothetical protein
MWVQNFEISSLELINAKILLKISTIKLREIAKDFRHVAKIFFDFKHLERGFFVIFSGFFSFFAAVFLIIFCKEELIFLDCFASARKDEEKEVRRREKERRQ